LLAQQALLTLAPVATPWAPRPRPAVRAPATVLGGMFSVVKVRRGQPAGDYRDPGWFRHPAGTTAFEWTGAPPAAASHAAHNPANDIQVQANKPGMGGMPMEH
jgi:hypothetical protein